MPRGGKRPNAGRKTGTPNGLLKKAEKSNTGEEHQGEHRVTSPRKKSGLMPPWKPGESGNPAGRKTAGAFVKDHINSLALHGVTEAELRGMAKDAGLEWTRRAAASRILRTLEIPDLADFQDAVDGVADLKSLRDSGINTEAVKKMKVKTRTIPGGKGEDAVTEVEREIELYDRAGEDFDRIMDRTEGKPTQAVKIDADVTYRRTPIDGETEADSLLAELARVIGAAAFGASAGARVVPVVADRGGGDAGQPQAVGLSGGVSEPAG